MEARMDDVHVRPLSGTIGAEIHGVEIASVQPGEMVDFIRTALVEYHVLFFPSQPLLSIERHIEFGRCFGPLETEFPSFTSRIESHPEIVFLDADRPNGRASRWHTDVSVSSTPPMGCVMQVKDLPDRGGDTMWADLCAAYDALSPAMQEFLERLTAVHDMLSDEYRERHGGVDLRRLKELDYSRVSRAEHPVVRVHPESKRKCLFVNPLFTSHIVGLRPAENTLLLNYLYSHIERPEFVCRRHWSKGDVAFWDNRCTVHRAVDDYGKGSRLVHRVSIKGDAPFGVHGVN
jgi:taurine dioxygenase